MTLYKWSQTASADATADSTINWAEGQSPSSVNDSARAMMAAIAKYRDDTSGAIVTGGTSTAYTLTSYQGFDNTSHLRGQLIAFVPHATNGGACTLNVDGLGAIPLRQINNIDLVAGTLVQSTPYFVVYSPTTGEFNFHNVFGNPYLIPIGSSIDFWGTSAPNSSFALAYGQAISRTTYATLFGLLGTTYGPGDGSTTFNIPDLRGRVVAGKDDMGGSAAARLSGTSITIGGATTLGGSGGVETKTLVTANLPPYTPVGTITNGAITPTVNGNTPVRAGNSTLSITQNGSTPTVFDAGALAITQAASTFTGVAQGGSSTPIVMLQPTIIANKLLRII